MPPRTLGNKTADTGSAEYLLAGQTSELEHLQLQSLGWEPSGRRLLAEIGDGHGARALDGGCIALGATREGLRNVGLVKDDLFADAGAPRSRCSGAGGGRDRHRRR